ncbi:MAG: hypothetical protein Kow0013_28420 [Pararhodobacter sp.]
MPVGIMAPGICHADVCRLNGFDIEDRFPSGPGHDGGGIVHRHRAGITAVPRAALGVCRRGRGAPAVIGLAEVGGQGSARPFRLATGRGWKGSAPGGARGRTDGPRRVDRSMSGKIESASMIAHVLTLDEINAGFDLMHESKSMRSVVVC